LRSVVFLTDLRLVTVFFTGLAAFDLADTLVRLGFFALLSRFLVAAFAGFAGDFLRGLDFDTLLTFLGARGILRLDNREKPFACG
jgi:hypothetical protein